MWEEVKTGFENSRIVVCKPESVAAIARNLA
jgi:hypothetical protein